MMSSYDRWITSEPVDFFSPYCEAVGERLYKLCEYEEEISNKVLNYCFDKGLWPDTEAKLIFKLLKKQGKL